MYSVLLVITNISEIFPLLLLLKSNFFRYNEIFIPLLDFLLAKAIMMLLSVIILSLNYWDMRFNSLFHNLYTIIYFVSVSRIYRTILIDINQNFFRVGYTLFLLILIINGFWFDFRFEFFNYTISIVNLIFIFYGIIFLFSSKKILISGNFSNYFLLNIAFLTYNICLFSAMVFDRLIILELSIFNQQLLWSVVLISSIMLNIFLSIFILNNQSYSENILENE